MRSSKFQVIIEEAKDGRLWGRIEHEGDLLTTSGGTMGELLDNFREQLEAFYDVEPMQARFDITLDVKDVFEAVDDINITGIAKRANMNASLVRQYATGRKNPSVAQVQKIEDAIHKLGKELTSIKIVPGDVLQLKGSAKAGKILAGTEKHSKSGRTISKGVYGKGNKGSGSKVAEKSKAKK